MIEDDKYTVSDLIVSAAQHQPTDFQDVFNSIMLDRISAAVDTKKQEIAQSMFGAAAITEPEEETNG